MSLDDLLELAEAPPVRVSFGTVAKATVTMAYRAWPEKGEIKHFPFKTKQEEAKAKAQCKAYLSGDDKRFPQRGILTTLQGDDVPTSQAGKVNWSNGVWEEFISDYHSEARARGNGKSVKAALTPEELENVKGLMPYDAVIEGLKALRDSGKSVNLSAKPVWCLLSQEVNWWRTAKGEMDTYNENDVPYRLYVIRDVFKSRTEAVAKAEELMAERPQVEAAEPFVSLSQTAQDNDWNIEGLQDSAKDIHEALSKKPKAVVLKDFGIEESDLDLLELEDMPF